MITVAILNKQRPVSYVRDIIDSINSQTITPDKIIVSTDHEVYPDCEEHDAITTIPVNGKNVASAKNALLMEALRAGTKRLFLIEDDIEIYKRDTLEKYISLMDELDLGMVCNGYTNKSNYVLTAPSPRVRFITDDMSKGFDAVITNRHEVGDFVLINLEKNVLNFAEELDYFEFSEYAFQCYKYGHIPALNQFFDIEDSWKYVGPRPNCSSTRKNDVKAINEDQKKMSEMINNQWRIENDLKVILDYIVLKLQGEK